MVLSQKLMSTITTLLSARQKTCLPYTKSCQLNIKQERRARKRKLLVKTAISRQMSQVRPNRQHPQVFLWKKQRKGFIHCEEEVHKEHHKQEAEKDKQEKDKANQAAAEEKKEQQEKKEESKEVSEATAKALTHAALLVGALSAAKQNEGIWMNKSQKVMQSSSTPTPLSRPTTTL